MTFKMKLMSVGGGVSDINFFLNTGDKVALNGTDATFVNLGTTGLSVGVPEPGTALLMGLGLAGLGLTSGRKR